MTSSSIYSECCSADSWGMGELDPLNALHDHILAAHPNLDTSILTDDEMIALLKSAKEPKDLAFLNIGLSKQTLDHDGSSTLAIDSPTISNQGSQFTSSGSSSIGGQQYVSEHA